MQSTAEQAALKGLGVDIKSKMTSFTANKINNPLLELGKGKNVQEGKEANFNLFGEEIFAPKHSIELGVIAGA